MPIPSFLEQLDPAVFAVPSATTDNDKVSLLRLQRLVSTSVEDFNYLEIGSDQGGSIVPLLADPNCAQVISVDLRPEQQPDERGVSFPYPVDGEAVMIANLRKALDPKQLARMRTYKSDIRDVNVGSVPKIDLVLIDGEHTNVACFSDADRILDFIQKDAVITFHDSNLISDAIQNFEKLLGRLGVEYNAIFLPDVVAAIGIGKFAGRIESDLGAFAAPRTAFLAEAQLHRWVAVANSMRTRGLIPDQTPETENAVAELRSRIKSLQSDLEQEKQGASSLRAELDQMRNRLEAFSQSASWKLTAPLRHMARLFKSSSA